MPTFTDPPERIESAIAAAEPQLRTAFLLAVSQIKDRMTISRITSLLEQGRLQDALNLASASWAQFANEWIRVYIRSASSAASFIDDKLAVVVSFNQVNASAVAEMQLNQLRLVQGLTAAQRQATSTALIEGIAEGLNPRQQARVIHDSIGLTARQESAVRNFRRLLEANSAEALTRELRDRRFDRTVQRSVREGTSLDKASIDRMVSRYRERSLAFRAETIARTESLRSVNQGTDRMYGQAIIDGVLQTDQLTRIWNTARDERVRGSHRSMHGQRREIEEDFVSGNGALLRLPGDPGAPASETIKCRCVVSHRFTAVILAEEEAFAA